MRKVIQCCATVVAVVAVAFFVGCEGPSGNTPLSGANSAGMVSLPTQSSLRAGLVESQTDPTILSNLSPKLSAAERSFMYGQLARLSLNQRKNVIVFEQDGTLHVNNPALLADITVWRDVPGTSNLAKDGAGHTMIRPSETRPSSNASQCGSAGFCLRRYSDTSFTYVSAGVSFPCASVTLVKNGTTADKGYAYVGVHDTKTTNPATEVDAGIQVSGNVIGRQPISVQAYMHAGSAGITYNPNPNHFTCDPSLSLAYQPVPMTEGMLTVNGSLVGGGNSVTAIADGINAPGSCATCEVKRVTSLTTPDLSSPDGSYFGINNVTTSPTPAIGWSNAMKGYVKPDGTIVNEGLFYETTNSGNILGSPPLILCTGVTGPPPGGTGSADETIGINYDNTLSGPSCSQ